MNSEAETSAQATPSAEPTIDEFDEVKRLLEMCEEEAEQREADAKTRADAFHLAQVAADALTDLRRKLGELSDDTPSDIADALDNAEGEIDTLVRALEDLTD